MHAITTVSESITTVSGSQRLPDLGAHPVLRTGTEVLAIWVTALALVYILSICGVNPSAISNSVAASAL